MKQFSISGMSCAACQAAVERAVSKLPGVSSCSVSLLTNSMQVDGTAQDNHIIQAVTQAGYRAKRIAEHEAVSSAASLLSGDEALHALRRRLWSSVAVLAVLMYFSMGHMLFGWPIPSLLHENPVYMGILQLVLTAVIIGINRKFFISGFKSALHFSPNMDTLVALGASASFLWSVYALIRMADAQSSSGAAAAMIWMDAFYFESAAMILTLITVGKTLEARSKGKTTDALRSLMKLSPKTATVIVGEGETTVPVEQVKPGDRFVVRPGEQIPVDGVVFEGESAVDEAALSGESIPVDKTVGSTVSAGTVNQFGFLRCAATRVGEDTTLSQIIRMVSDAAATKAPIAKIADKVSGIFVPVVLLIAAITFTVWMLLGRDVGFSLARAIAVLVISCPCALGLATPVAIMVGSGLGAKNGILFKTAEALETAGKVQIVALDKTGTITRGVPTVAEFLPADGVTKEALLLAAYALEARSEHPLAKAVIQAAEQLHLPCKSVSDFRAAPGNGLMAILENAPIYGGSLRFIESKTTIASEIRSQADALSDRGCTPLFFVHGDRYLGMIAVADSIKDSSEAAIRQLQELGIEVVMLTGDNPRTAAYIANQANIKHIVSGVLPEQKHDVIQKLSAIGSVAMVGDGINDAPALTAATVGIAIGAGTDVAIDAADVVLMHSEPTDVAAAIRLSRATKRNILENLFWAFIYNIIGIPLAAGCWIGLFGWELNPMFGAAAMSLSSVCVVSNALRLNLFRPHKAVKPHRSVNQEITSQITAVIQQFESEKEKRSMTKTIRIEGMMCMHCEAHVKKALEALDGVSSAVASHEDGTAVVTLTKELADTALKAAVEAEGYTVTGIDER